MSCSFFSRFRGIISLSDTKYKNVNVPGFFVRRVSSPLYQFCHFKFFSSNIFSCCGWPGRPRGRLLRPRPRGRGLPGQRRVLRRRLAVKISRARDKYCFEILFKGSFLRIFPHICICNLIVFFSRLKKFFVTLPLLVFF